MALVRILNIYTRSLVILVACVSLSGASFSSFHLTKFQSVLQDSDSDPDTGFSNYGFGITTFLTPEDAEVYASVTLPGGAELPLDLGLIPGTLEFFDDFYATTAERDAEYPPGDYLVTLIPDAETTQTATFSLPANTHPDPLTLLNFIDVQLVNPAEDTTFTWSASGLTGPDDCIQVALMNWTSGTYDYVSPDPGLPGALAPGETSITIPAGTLVPYEYYSLELRAHKVITVDTAQIPGTTGSAAYTTITLVDFEATELIVPDTIPPVLVDVDPPNGAENVDPATSVTFTFNEPMAPDVGILWEPEPTGGSYSWSADQLTLTYSHDPFPAGQAVRWTLNPGPSHPVMGDVAGNSIPTNSVTGTFIPSSVLLGTAPAEWLPGPNLALGQMEELPELKVVMAAESLEGYEIQKSSDLETWTKVTRVASNDSLLELDIVPPSEGEAEFYRFQNYGLPLLILKEESAKVEQWVLTEGATLTTTGGDGTVYTLTIPPGALMSPTLVSMTPIDEIVDFPLSQGVDGAVLLEPDGLQLMTPATLRITKPGPILETGLLGFSSKSDGTDLTWTPWSVENGNDLVLLLSHFSAQGAGRGSNEEIEDASCNLDPDTCDDPLRRLQLKISCRLGKAAQASASGDEDETTRLFAECRQLQTDYYDTVLLKDFEKALKDRNFLPCANQDWIILSAGNQLLGGDGFTYPSIAAQAMQKAYDEAFEKCRNGDFREFFTMVRLAAQGQLLGLSNFDDVLNDLNDCLTFKMDVVSDIHYTGDIYRGHHRVEAKDIPVKPDSLPHVFTGSGPLDYKAFELNHNYPIGCDPDIKDLATVGGGIGIYAGSAILPETKFRGCECDSQSLDPEGVNDLDFLFIFNINSPQESWKESQIDPDSSDCYYFTQNATDWKDLFAVVHKEDVFAELTGEFYEPLYVVITEFDFLNQESGGRRKVAQKQVFKSIPFDTIWWNFEGITAETTITIWHDPPTPPAN